MASVVDRLALDRTRLANERTLLAYLRTALGLAAAGATLMRFFPHTPLDRIVGVALMAFGLALLIVGVWRFTSEHRRYKRLEAEMR